MKTIALKVSKQFTRSVIDEIAIIGNGLINDTFLVSTNSKSYQRKSFVLQRINSQVFPDPGLIMENLILLNQHIRGKNTDSVKLKIPLVLKAINQDLYYKDDQNTYWRALEFISNTESKESINHLNQANQVGFALGHFHCLLSDVSVGLFHDTLPGFHVTAMYFEHYQWVLNQDINIHESTESQCCRNFIEKFQTKINVLEDARKKCVLKERIIHGDPKLNNFLFSRQSDKIISLIDLDTVKPGLVHYDIADCLRSCCHIVQTNTFDLEKCKAILNCYLNEVGVFFKEQDYQYLYPAIQLIPFELGLRFFTDYLEGNQYFKVDSPEQNLNRALAQFYLCESITEQESEIKQMIEDSRKTNLA